MAECIIQTEILTNIAEAIRLKTNTTDRLYPQDMPQAIQSINVKEENNQEIYTGDLYCINTATATPASGVSSISFNNITKQPDLFIVYVDTLNINQYHRAGIIQFDGTKIQGQEYYTSGDCYFYENTNTASSYRWRYSYSGTTLTISSYSNSQGGYFHNPGVYTLVYMYKDNENGQFALGDNTTITSTGGNIISIPNVQHEPALFVTTLLGNQDAQAASKSTIVMAGIEGYSQMSNASSANLSFVSSTSHYSYNDNTFTISAGDNAVFSANNYSFIYFYTPYLGEGIENLPTLTNPGTAADLLLGKQLINGIGRIVTGTHECESPVQKTNPTTFSTGWTGSTTVNVGFKPDFVYIDGDTTAYNYGTKIGAAFTESNTSEIAFLIVPLDTDTYIGTRLVLTQTDTGFSVRATNVTSDGTESACTRRNITYSAVKYT